jgi:hypothetical protein
MQIAWTFCLAGAWHSTLNQLYSSWQQERSRWLLCHLKSSAITTKQGQFHQKLATRVHTKNLGATSQTQLHNNLQHHFFCPKCFGCLANVPAEKSDSIGCQDFLSNPHDCLTNSLLSFKNMYQCPAIPKTQQLQNCRL